MLLYQLILSQHQNELLQTELGKVWKAINAKQKQMAIVCNNVHTKIVLNLLETKQLIMRAIFIEWKITI